MLNTHQETPGPTKHKDRADLTKEGVPSRYETDEPGDRAPSQSSQTRKHRRRGSPGTGGVRAVKFTETEQTVRVGAGGGAGLKADRVSVVQDEHFLETDG